MKTSQFTQKLPLHLWLKKTEAQALEEIFKLCRHHNKFPKDKLLDSKKRPLKA